MKKEWIKIAVVFFVTVGAVFLALNYLFLSGKAAQKSKAAGETIELTFNPSSATTGASQDIRANQDFTTVLKIKSNINITLRGYRVKINFDKTKMQVKNIQYKLGVTSQGLGDNNTNLATINKNGSFSLIGESQNSTGQLVTGGTVTDLVTLTFTASSASGATLKIDTMDASFYIFDSNMTLFEIPISTAAQFDINGGGAVITPGVTGNPTPTITPGGPTLTPTPTGTTAGNTKIDLKLKFQGIAGKPADARNSMNVKFTLSGADLTTPLVKSGTFTADANGIWSGRVGFDLTSPAGKKYILYVKGPRHVQKKVCDIAPTETSQGTYSCSAANFTLALGDNARTLSGILLLSGDIYGSEKAQDGVVNSVDLSFVKNNLNKTDAATLAVCDINLDGGCDTQDYSLILSSLSIKSDEL